jgi:Ca2+-binding RTX toxin-like protein
LTGNNAANILDGKSGGDRMFGAAGNDTYVVDSASDRVFERTSQGTDTVRSSVTHTLGSNVEHLLLTGSASIDGTGNGLRNSIKGNAGNNDIRGGAGVDTLTGGAGSDKFVWGDRETGVGAGNRDIITDFVSGVDKIDLSLIDAATYAWTPMGPFIDTAGDQAFRVFLGTLSYWTGAGGPLNFCQVRYSYDAGLNATIVQLNVQTVEPTYASGTGPYVNNDLVTDYEIQLSGNITLQSTDFIL